MKCLGCGKLPKHPRQQWSARQTAGSVLGMVTRTVRIVGPQAQ